MRQDSFNVVQDRVEMALGLWLVICPWVWEYRTGSPEAWCSMLGGVAIVVMAFEDQFFPNLVEEWGTAIAGGLLAASPWLVGYTDQSIATGNALLVGCLVSGSALLAVSQLWHTHSREELKERGL